MTPHPHGHDDFSTDDFLALTSNDVEMQHGLLHIFLAEAPMLSDRLDRALAAGSHPEVASAAHSLCSLLATVGGRAAFRCAGAIERAAKAGDLSTATALRADLSASTQSLRAALIAFVGREQRSC